MGLGVKKLFSNDAHEEKLLMDIMLDIQVLNTNPVKGQ